MDTAAHQGLFDNFDRVLDAARDLFQQKSRAYGVANIAQSGEEGVLIRMSDKFARIRNKDIPGESVDDTLIDVINYSAILLLLRAGRWPGYQRGAASFDLDRALQILEAGAAGISAPALEGDVGYDLRAACDAVVPGAAKGPTYIPTGVRVKAPEGVWTRIVGRSSTTRRGILVVEGVIDNAYTGELLVACINFAGEDVQVKEGDRLAQLVCCPVITPKLAIVEELPATARGDKGFGSTGETIEASTPARRLLQTTG
jgi:dUTP pyrophosphatase